MMFFKNFTMFRFPRSLDLSALPEAVAERPLKPVGPMELSSIGFVHPYGQAGEGDPTAISSSGALWITVGTETRLLPPAVVNAELQRKIAEFEEKNHRRPGGKMRRQMKEDLIAELLPRAFVSPGRLDAIIDTKRGVIAVNATSRRAAENVVSMVRQALGSFPALPVNAEVAPRAVMTGWIAGEPLPARLAIGDECELRDPADGGAVVKAQRVELPGDEIEGHLNAGMQAARIALTLDDRATFVIGEDLVVRKFKLTDVALESLESTEREDLQAELDARFALMSGEFGRMFDALESAFSLSTAEA